MTPEMHATLGLAVLLVNLVVGVWAMLQARRGALPTGALRLVVLLAGVLLVVQVLVGADLWFRGGRPAPSPWAEIHVLLPVLALNQFVVFLVLRRPGALQTRRYGTAALSTAFVALLSYGIGQMAS